MADHASHDHAHEAHGEHTHHPNYVKIWAILLGAARRQRGRAVPRHQARHADHRLRHRDREGVPGRQELHAHRHRGEGRDLPGPDDAAVHAAVLRGRRARRDGVARLELGEAELGRGHGPPRAARRRVTRNITRRVLFGRADPPAPERTSKTDESPRARVEPGAGDADLRDHGADVLRGLHLGVHDHARLGGDLAAARSAASAGRRDRVQHRAPARERRGAAASARGASARGPRGCAACCSSRSCSAAAFVAAAGRASGCGCSRRA